MRQRRIVNFLVGVFKSSSSIGGSVLRYCKTAPTSQIKVYLGSEGFNSKTPLRNLITSGCVPNVMLPVMLITVDSAERAVLIAL